MMTSTIAPESPLLGRGATLLSKLSSKGDFASHCSIRKLKSRISYKLPTDDCIVFNTRERYYRIKFLRKRISAHRISYLLFVGDVPCDMQVCHRCDNGNCLNPNHLFLGTNADNAADRNSKGRTARGFDMPQTVIPTDVIKEARRLRLRGLTLRKIASILDISNSYVHRLVTVPTARLDGVLK